MRAWSKDLGDTFIASNNIFKCFSVLDYYYIKKITEMNNTIKKSNKKRCNTVSGVKTRRKESQNNVMVNVGHSTFSGIVKRFFIS